MVGEITATWRQIQRRHPELPAAMFTLGEDGETMIYQLVMTT